MCRIGPDHEFLAFLIGSDLPEQCPPRGRWKSACYLTGELSVWRPFCFIYLTTKRLETSLSQIDGNSIVYGFGRRFVSLSYSTEITLFMFGEVLEVTLCRPMPQHLFATIV